MLYKNLNASVTDIDPVKGVMTGYLSNWDNLDSDGDFTVKGKTFVKTVTENGPKGKGTIQYLLNHKWETPAGVFTSISEDNTGLPYEAQLTKNRAGIFTPRSEEIMALYDTGYKFNHSYGYKVIQQQKTAMGNMLTELKMHEGSILTMPGANSSTPATGLKWDNDQDAIEQFLELSFCLEKALHRGNWSDQAFELLQKHKDAIELALKSLKATEPEIATQPDADQKAKNEALIAAFRKGLFANN